MKSEITKNIIFQDIALWAEWKTLLDFTFTAPQLIQCYFETWAALQTEAEQELSTGRTFCGVVRVHHEPHTVHLPTVTSGERLTQPNSKSEFHFKTS